MAMGAAETSDGSAASPERDGGPDRTSAASPEHAGPDRTSAGEAAGDLRVPEAGAATQRVIDGRYLIEGLLGSGGMAVVWRARDLRLDRPVAVKELTGYGLTQPKALERFDREARAAARLSHPHIVPVHDFGTRDGHPYLVMELVDGPTVADLLRAGPLSPAQALGIAAQACEGLAAAHAAGIVHRDVKPANIVMTPGGTAKICDFGVAWLSDASRRANLTAVGVAMGSAMYMAPEQINGAPVDPRIDLYGLGCTMYEMLAGAPPFAADTAVAVARQQLTQPPKPLRTRRPDVPPEVETLVAQLLAKNPDVRPVDAASLAARIAALAAHRAPATASPATSDVAPSTSAVVAPSRDPRRGWIVAAAVAAVVSLIAVYVLARSGLWQSAGDRSLPAVARTVTGFPSPTVAASPTATASPTVAASAVPAASAAEPGPSRSPVDPISAMRLSIRQQVDAGMLDPDAGTDLLHLVNDLAKSLTTANTDDEKKKLKALRDKLAALYRDAKLTNAAYQTLNGEVDQVAANVG